MIVVLHGMPGKNGKQLAHETGRTEFQQTLTIRVSAWLGLDAGKLCGFKGLNVPPPTEHDLTFVFTHHDGTYSHYEFSALVDGA